MAKGFGGLPGNMQALMKQAQNMQQQLLKAQEESEGITAEGSAGGGMVKVVANGKNELVTVTVDPEVMSDDVEMLQDLFLAAANEALRKVQEQVKSEMGKLTGGLNIPGLT